MRSRGGLGPIVAMVAVVGVLLAACTGGSSGNKSSSTPAPSVLTVTASQEMDDLNPFGPALQGRSEILSAIGTPLLYMNANNEATSQVLKSWTQSSDGKTVTLTLKPEIKWSDGQQLTSADMLMSLEVYLDATISANAGRIGAVVGEDALANDTTTAVSDLKVSGLTAPDANTVKVDLTKPDASWLNKLAILGDYWPILPEHILGKDTLATVAKDDFFKKWPVTSGPYVLEKYSQGVYVQVTENPNWFGGKPGFKSVVFKLLGSDQMAAQLQTNEIQFIYPVVPTDAARVKALPGVTMIEHSGVAPDAIGLNNASPLLQDPRVRQAIVYGTDRAGICKQVLAGHCTTSDPNFRLMGPDWALPTSDLTEYKYDPTRAKELLAAAGWNSNTQLTIITRDAEAPSAVKQALTIMQGQLGQVGIKIKLQSVSTAELLDLLKKKSGWEGYWISGGVFALDPSTMADYATCAQRYPAGPNLSQFCNAQVDDLFAKGLTQTDQTQRSATYQAAFKILNEQVGEMYLFTSNSIAAYNSHLQGPVPFGNTQGGYWDIGKWHWQS